MRPRAADAYREAAAWLPEARGWLLLRAARAGDDPDAPALTSLVPPGADGLARAARADLLLRAGDTVRAVDALIVAGRRAHAARLELATGDSLTARSLTYAALASADTGEVAAALRLVERHFLPSHPDEYLAGARAAEHLRDRPLAAQWTRAAVRAGDSSAATAVLLGDRLDRAGERRAAVAAYREGGGTGAYRAARLLVRLRDTRAARAALETFRAAYPDHADAPVAAYLLADLADDAAALAAVAERWPAHRMATRVRLRLAARALRARDTATALRWYRREAEGGGENGAARYLLHQLERARGDTAAWRAGMERLAARDPLGFYGLAARRAAGLGAPALTSRPVPEPPPEVATVLAQLDALDACGFSDEAELLVADAARRFEPAARLAFAEGLVVRGRAPEAIALGWQVSGTVPLTDARLVRVLFPWPERAMILAEARKFELDPWLMAGLIRQESRFRTRARSRAGATGLMQLMPATARAVARRLGVPWSDRLRTVADANLHVGAAHLAALLRQFDQEVPVAIAAYNAGGTPARRWRRSADPAEMVAFVEAITYPETRGYVRAVLRNAALYRALYPDP